jgi:hypothetical protein
MIGWGVLKSIDLFLQEQQWTDPGYWKVPRHRLLVLYVLTAIPWNNVCIFLTYYLPDDDILNRFGSLAPHFAQEVQGAYHMGSLPSQIGIGPIEMGLSAYGKVLSRECPQNGRLQWQFFVGQMGCPIDCQNCIE